MSGRGSSSLKELRSLREAVLAEEKAKARAIIENLPPNSAPVRAKQTPPASLAPPAPSTPPAPAQPAPASPAPAAKTDSKPQTGTIPEPEPAIEPVEENREAMSLTANAEPPEVVGLSERVDTIAEPFPELPAFEQNSAEPEPSGESELSNDPSAPEASDDSDASGDLQPVPEELELADSPAVSDAGGPQDLLPDSEAESVEQNAAPDEDPFASPEKTAAIRDSEVSSSASTELMTKPQPVLPPPDAPAPAPVAAPAPAAAMKPVSPPVKEPALVIPLTARLQERLQRHVENSRWNPADVVIELIRSQLHRGYPAIHYGDQVLARGGAYRTIERHPLESVLKLVSGQGVFNISVNPQSAEYQRWLLHFQAHGSSDPERSATQVCLFELQTQLENIEDFRADGWVKTIAADLYSVAALT